MNHPRRTPAALLPALALCALAPLGAAAESWSPAGPWGGDVRSLAGDSRDPRVVYVGYWEVHGAGGGVARSRDGGATFELLEGIAGQPVKALSVAPSDSGSLVAGTRDGVFRSRDGGRTWARISPEGDAELRNIDSIAIDPGDPDTIYAGTWHLPWKTTDGGHTWKGVHAGMIDDSEVMTLIIDRRSPRVVYATACS